MRATQKTGLPFRGRLYYFCSPPILPTTTIITIAIVIMDLSLMFGRFLLYFDVLVTEYMFLFSFIFKGMRFKLFN